MQPNKFFSMKPRTCPQSDENEIILLKMTMLQHLQLEKCISYSDRLMMFRAVIDGEEGIRILRPMYPEVSTDLKPGSLSKAVDFFVDQFLYESDLNLDNVRFHETEDLTSSAAPWSIVKRNKLISSLL